MLSRETLVSALTLLSDELGRLGVKGELNIVGGTAMVLAFDARKSTKDVDAIFEPTADVRHAATAVSGPLGLPPDWLNDAAKGFMSPSGDFTGVETIELPHLRVQAPTAEYMLAMKVLAARSGLGEVKGDRADIAFLIRLLGLRDSEYVMEVVARYG